MNISTVQNIDTEGVRGTPQAPVRSLNSSESAQPTNNISLLKPTGKANEDTTNRKDAPDKNSTKEVVAALNDYMEDLQTNLRFAIREDLDHQVVVEIKNRKTDELVRQIPSEELLKIMENMKELTGIIFDQSV